MESNTSKNENSNENGILKRWHEFFQDWKERTCGKNTYGLCMDYISKSNLFILCCITASLTLIICLASFSCEVSWILEHRGALPTPAFVLCTFYFMFFVSATILIHGLATGIPWGLLCWSIIIGILSIPELCLVMYMTFKYWGLQSTHGTLELVGYLIRLLVACLTLICVIPTALRWRREQKVLNQLQSLATRLALSPSTACHTFIRNMDSSRNSGRKLSGFDNPTFMTHQNQSTLNNMIPSSIYNMYGSQNEFNASIFGLNSLQCIGPPGIPNQMAIRTQSLLDLRCITSPFTPDSKTMVDNIPLSELRDTHKMNNLRFNPDEIVVDPIYHTINSKKTKPLGRNCISLENLNEITSTKNEHNTNKNFVQHYYNKWPKKAHPIPDFYEQYPPHTFSYYMRNPHQPMHMQQPIPINYGYGTINNPYSNSNNTSQGNISDDYRKYRDVAL